MKTGMMITLLTILATGHIFSQTALPKPLPVVPADGVAQLEGLIGTGLTAKPVKPRKVLVFTSLQTHQAISAPLPIRRAMEHWSGPSKPSQERT